jgi:hypothetical protein
MTGRVGYRALILDNEGPAFRLSQFLLRPEVNNKVIQSVGMSDVLGGDAYAQAEQCEFIYIDPLYFGLAEAIRFIVEVQSRSPVKAFTLFRSGRQWQEHLRELDSLAIPPAKLRRMLVIDKDQMGDTSFMQQVRHNIQSMEGEYQREWQTHGTPMMETLGSRSGLFDTQRDIAFAASGVGGLGVPQWQIQQIIEGVANVMNRQSPMQTHSMTTPLLTAPLAMTQLDALNLPQVVPQLKQDLTAVQQQINTLQQGATKAQDDMVRLQDQVTGAQRGQRDLNRQHELDSGRIQNVESWQTRNDLTLKKMTAQLRTMRIALIGMGVALGLLLIAVLFMLLTGHH